MLFVGDDWAETHHDVELMDAAHHGMDESFVTLLWLSALSGLLLLVLRNGAPMRPLLIAHLGVEPPEPVVEAFRDQVVAAFEHERLYAPADLINGWAAKFKQYGKINEMVIYPGAAHAFFNERSAAYDLGSANQSWDRMAGFLEKRL